MKILDNKELQALCNKIYNKAVAQNSFFVPHLFFLKNFGLRISEVVSGGVQYIDNEDNLHIQTSKKNNERIIRVQDSQVVFMLENMQNKCENYLNKYKTLQREIKQLNPIRNLMCGKKNISAHVFRHNYIRNLYENGMSFEEINEHLGYTTQKAEYTYLNSIIYYK